MEKVIKLVNALAKKANAEISLMTAVSLMNIGIEPDGQRRLDFDTIHLAHELEENS